MRAPGESIHSSPSNDVPPPPTGSADEAVIDRPVVGPWLQLGRTGPFEWNVARLPVPGLHPDLEGLRIVHVTDVHIRKRWRPEHSRFLPRSSHTKEHFFSAAVRFIIFLLEKSRSKSVCL